MPSIATRAVLVTLLVGMAFSPMGCGSRQLLTDVSVRPAVISPNADGVDDVTQIRYTLSAQSTLTMYVTDETGTRHYLREGLRRSKGQRTTLFSGVVDGTLLPDGAYTCVIEAADARGRTARVEVPLSIRDGDKRPLRIQNLSIYPRKFTPNRDGITDRVKIGYNLSKPVRRVDVYILGADGAKYPVSEDKIREAGSAGSHEHDYDAGIDLGATPPTDGEYRVVVDAEDAVGNKARAEGALTIDGGGVPRVEIVNAAAVFDPSVVPLGASLTFTCTVKNIGTVPVRTKGPPSGATYGTLENYNTKAEYEEPGTFRVGLDYEGNSEGRLYPFRWQLGSDEDVSIIETDIGPHKYLMPGQAVTVVGHLRIVNRPSKVAPYYWLGLIHEQVWIVQDRVEPTQVSIGF